MHLLTLYQWNTKAAMHYFCKVCGIYTHHQRRSNPMQYGFNVACIDAKLGNAAFVAKAPEEVIEEQKERRAEAAALASRIHEALKRLSS